MVKTKLLWVLKQDLRKLRKGSIKMSEVHQLMVDTIKKVGKGEVPLKTAETQHLAAHRAVMDTYSEIRKKEVGIDAESLARVKESVQQL